MLWGGVLGRYSAGAGLEPRSVVGLLQASACGCVSLMRASRWRWSSTQNGTLYALLTLWSLFAAIVASVNGISVP